MLVVLWWCIYICNKLRAAGLPHVDGIFAQKRIPTLEELQKYCGVLVYSYNSSAFLDGSLMGDLLADYVDNGGGVVVTVFTNCNNLRNGFLKGRFLEGNYHPILPARQHDTNGKRPLSLGRVHDPVHPIMAQVKNIDGGKSSFFCPGAVQPGAKLVSDWSNGVPLVVDLAKNKGTVVGLNFFPPSCDTGDPRFWNANSDGAILMANALAHAGHSSVLRKRRTTSKRHLEYKASTDGAGEDMVNISHPPLSFSFFLVFLWTASYVFLTDSRRSGKLGKGPDVSGAIISSPPRKRRLSLQEKEVPPR